MKLTENQIGIGATVLAILPFAALLAATILAAHSSSSSSEEDDTDSGYRWTDSARWE